ncbi:MAG: hypothetical protein HYZ60_04570, partial [Methylocystis sp.]|nr:hypothetical protein [Methylocystis sp.]
TILGLVGGLLRAVAAFFGWKQQHDALAAGRGEEAAARDAAELRAIRRQGEIVAEQRTSEDAAKRLDNGSF